MKKHIGFMGIALLTAQSWAIQVTPTYQVFEVKPGGRVEGELTLTNSELREVTITPSVKDWFVLKGNERFPAETWLKASSEPFGVKSGESKKFKFTAEAPKKAKGELVGMLTFSSKPPEGVTVTMQMSLAMYVAVKGTEKLGHEISALSIDIGSHTSVGILMLNTGNVHLRPKGWVYVTDESGAPVLNVELEKGKPAFPGVPRVYSGVVKNYRLAKGRYTARIALEDMDRAFYSYPEKIKKFSVTNGGKVDADQQKKE